MYSKFSLSPLSTRAQPHYGKFFGILVRKSFARPGNFRSLLPSIRFSTQPMKTSVNENTTVVSIIESLHQATSWRRLSENFTSVTFTEPMIQSVILQLKEPISSRKALNFFHWSAKEMHLEHGISSYCIMIHILAKARLVKDARALLESVLAKYDSSSSESKVFAVLDVLIESYGIADSVPFVFDLFVQTCAKLRTVEGILDAFKLLFDLGFVLSVISFNTVLHVIEKSEKSSLVWGVYEHMMYSRICPNEVTTRIMVNALCKGGKLGSFLSMVDKMHGKRCPVPQITVNTYLIHEMIRKNRIEEGMVLLKLMLQKNMILDTISYSLVVFAKVKMGNLSAAQEIYEEMLKRGFAENAFVYSLFVEAHSEKGRFDEAIGVLEEMKNFGLKPTEDAFNKLIKGCSLTGRLDESLVYCKKMIEMQLLPSCSAVNEMFGKLCENGKTKEADEILTILLDKSFTPDEQTYSHLALGYRKEGKVDQLSKLLYEMEYRSLSPCMISSASIGNCGRLEEAESMLR